MIVLNDDGWTRFAGVPAATRDCPYFAALHAEPISETESTKSWSSCALALSATATDCRCACALNDLDRTSGTQIWIGRKP